MELSRTYQLIIFIIGYHLLFFGYAYFKAIFDIKKINKKKKGHN